jgi:anti-sigma regulatory factor (Ser/Thr protein kinase)
MAQNPQDSPSIFIFPTESSEDTAENFMRTLEKHFSSHASELTIIDCLSFPQLLSDQVSLLSRIIELYKDANIQLLLQPGQNGLTESIRALCVDNYSAVSTASQSSEPRDVATGKKAYPSEKEYNDKFYNTGSDIYNACLKLDEYLLTLECGPKIRYIIKIIFYEFVNNILLHSQMNSEDKILFDMTISNNTITMTFIDSGIQFDMSQQLGGPYESALNEEGRLSFGIALIKSLSDKIEYVRFNELKNITTIICERSEECISL